MIRDRLQEEATAEAGSEGGKGSELVLSVCSRKEEEEEVNSVCVARLVTLRGGESASCLMDFDFPFV